MNTAQKFNSELNSIKDSIGSDLVPFLEDLSSIIDESVTVLDGVERHDMDIKKGQLKSIIGLVNDEIKAFKSQAKAVEPIKFADFWPEDKDDSLREVRKAEIEAAKAAREAAEEDDDEGEGED